MTKQYWTKAHAYYSQQEWIKKPSMFAEFAIQHFPKKGKVLDLGAGQGQDSRFFAERGYEVVSTDYEKFALGVNESNIPPELKEKIEVKEIDLLEELPFHNREFDIVYSHLSLHYFNSATTKKIFDEIGRILKTDGIIALFVNSTEDPEYNTGTKIEEDYFEIEGLKKRFFKSL